MVAGDVQFGATARVTTNGYLRERPEEIAHSGCVRGNGARYALSSQLSQTAPERRGLCIKRAMVGK